MHGVSDHLNRLRLLWPIGAAFLFGLSIYLLVAGAAVYGLLHVAGWIFGFDPAPWFLGTALVWAPVVTGYALSAMPNERVVVYLDESHPPGHSIAGSPPPQAPGKSNKSISTVALIMVMAGILAANLAPIVLAIEFIEWLTSSEWPGLTVADGLAVFGIIRDLPETESQRLIDLVLAIPLSISLFTVGLLLCVTGLNLGDWSVRGPTWLPRRE